MHPPAHIVERLYAIESTARLAWDGEAKKFALLQLYHARDAERTFFGDFWSGRGPIFGRHFDPLQKVPMMVALLSPDDVVSGAFLCRCVDCLRVNKGLCPKLGCGHEHKGVLLSRWMRPIKERTIASAVRKGKEYQSSLNDLAEAGGDYLHWQAMKSTNAPNKVPREFVTKEEKAVLTGESIKGVENVFVDNMKTGQPIV